MEENNPHSVVHRGEADRTDSEILRLQEDVQLLKQLISIKQQKRLAQKFQAFSSIF
ncbi:hypothetical protein P5G51_016755 [Virgibacillus sp. 179-BFC.A HS]|uniref:Uncharacterized protein n=1 Tax=Tigheibacillus jepli TaxID=3035914 RepID=A0ABU5CKB9_9BACI|nr:hypothetical protein [Virgibacillus sp. 179-BFC.A HS]MDY0406788.1 hypothetical protein [Virgibacillus sp. 179-BFC.A HS]